MANIHLPLSLAIISCNEERNLRRCLESAKGLVSEIIIVDSGSTDRTLEIAADFDAQTFNNPWPGHIAQKNVALSRCSQEWVLSLDADEAISPELRQALYSLFANGGPDKDGYWMKRKTFYLGRWIEHAWYPDWCLRLVKREHARWEGINPHDKLTVRGSEGKLSGDIFHYSYSDLRDHFERTLNYGRIGAEALISKGIRFQWYKLVFSPVLRLINKLIIKSAWRDGWRGWIIAYSSFLTCFTKYAFIYEATLKTRKHARVCGDKECE